MTRFLVRLAASLMVLFAVVLVGIRAQPYDDSALQEIRDSLSGCPTPCFLGIQPGITTSNEAFAILRDSDWIRNLRMEKGGLIWEWSGIQPFWIDTHLSGRLGLYQRKVGSITLATRFTLNDAILAFGLPAREDISSYEGYGSYEGIYTTKGLMFRLSYTCPIKINPLKIHVSSVYFMTSMAAGMFHGWSSWQELYTVCI